MASTLLLLAFSFSFPMRSVWSSTFPSMLPHSVTLPDGAYIGVATPSTLIDAIYVPESITALTWTLFLIAFVISAEELVSDFL